MTNKKDNGTRPEETRYEQVKRILQDASGGSNVLYQGYKEFWNLPLEQLLELELFGFRMIAPADESGGTWDLAASPDAPANDGGGGRKSCCGGGDTDAPEATPAKAPTSSPGRGAQSWLIKALRGEFPFDNSQYPPFLWGDKATPVLATDIQFIENWIDDGCPADDEVPEPRIAKDGSTVSAHEAGVVMADTNGFRDPTGEINLRLNALYLSAEEQQAVRGAFRAAKDLNAYPRDNRSFNAAGKIHGDHCQHGWEQFLTWHRIFLFEFERQLQQSVSGVTLPYWEWTNPFFQKGIVPEGKQSGIIPPLYRCWVDAKLLANLKPNVSARVYSALQRIETDGSDPSKMYNSAWELFVQAGLGKDDYLNDNRVVVDQLVQVNPMWHPLRYPGMFYKGSKASAPQSWKEGYELDPKTGEPILSPAALGSAFHHHYPLAEDIDQILGIGDWPGFGGGHSANQSFGALSQNPHNTGHIWLGGGNPYFNNDNSYLLPIPTYGPEPVNRQPQYGDMFQDLLAGFDPMFWGHHSNVDRLFYEWQKRHPSVGPLNINDVLVPFNARVEQALNAEKLGYRYASSSRLMVADSQQEMRKLKTDPMTFDEGMLDCHRHAEITFHQVRRSNKSYFVRVFLNLPTADADTPLDDIHYVGRFARFGHGGCIGGPGHCDPPPKQRERYWPRPRHHNDDHCYTLDATEAVQRLWKAGERKFHINIVTVDPSGNASEGLHMQALSLNFYD